MQEKNFAMKMKTKVVLFFIIGIFLLSGCSVSLNVAAKIGQKTIAIEMVLEKQKIYDNLIYTQSETEKEDWESRLKNTLDLTVYDEVLKEEPKVATISSAEIDAVKNSVIKKLGGDELYQRQLKNYHVSASQMEKIFEEQAREQKHRELFEKETAVSDQQLENFFNKNKDLLSAMNYVEFIVPTAQEAEKIKNNWKKDPKTLTSFIQEYNHDEFSNTSAKEFRNVHVNSDQLDHPEIADLKAGDVKVFYDNEGYHVVLMQKKAEQYSEMKDFVKTAYLEDAYRTYVQKLYRDHGVQIFWKNLEKLRQESDVSMSNSGN